MKYATKRPAMTRLFDRRDIEFLRSVPGYRQRAESEFRRRRCRIFRAYLCSIRAEFAAATAEFEDAAQESQGYGELASWLLRYRLQLTAAMLTAYLRLLRYRWDLGSVQLTDVVLRFDAILADVRHSVPQAE